MPDDRRLDGRVALVTGAGRGLGAAHALLLARLGAAVLVNDAGGAVDGSAHDGSGDDGDPAAGVVAEIAAAGGEAAADRTPVGSWESAEAVVAHAVRAFGRLDIVVNNAGILRPKTIVGMTARDWSDVLRVHLDATFTLTHAAAVHWRARAKRGAPAPARVINTTSVSGLFGQGQANYAAAKAAIVAVTLIAAQELAAYGATANAVAPVADTRMAGGRARGGHTPEHAARLVGWLCSDAAAGVSGEVFNVAGGHVSVVERAHTGPGADRPDGDEPWSLDELDRVVPGLLARAPAHPDVLGYRPGEPRPASLAGIGLARPDR